MYLSLCCNDKIDEILLLDLYCHKEKLEIIMLDKLYFPWKNIKEVVCG